MLIGGIILQIFPMKFPSSRFSHDDEDESEKHLSDETILIATALLSKTPTNSIMHSSKNPSSTTVRHRVRFKSSSDN